MNKEKNQFCRRTRREFLWQAGAGFTSVALAAFLGDDGFLGKQAFAADGVTPFAPPAPSPGARVAWRRQKANVSGEGEERHLSVRCTAGRRRLTRSTTSRGMKGMDGKTIDVKTFGRGGHKNQGRIVEPKFTFQQYGQSGKWVSSLFPNLATCVDDIAFLHSMTADSPIHGSAMLQMNTGKILSGSPCIGSWVNYGLGSENQDLPGFVVMLDPRGGPISGAKNWSSGYMPATYQATVVNSGDTPILDLKRPDGLSEADQRRMLTRPQRVQYGTRSPAER